MPAGRPTKYDPIKHEGPLVYALSNKSGIFYVGSTKNARNRFASYANKRTHGNRLLLKHLNNDFQIIVLHRGEDFRDKEIEIIKRLEPVCNLSVLRYHNKRFGFFYGYCQTFKNRFGNTEFLNELIGYFKSCNDFEKQKIDDRFALWLPR